MQHTLNRMQRVFVALAVAIGMATTLVAQQIPSQIPQTMSYQVVIRNASNSIVSAEAVNVRISIIRGILSASTVYSEVHSGVTNQAGLLSVEIGNGQAIAGTFSSIDWSKGPYAVRTEVASEAGDNYSIVSTTPLLGVPYAQFAQSAERVTGFDYKDLVNKPLNVSSFINDAGYVTREEMGIGKTGESTQAGVLSTLWSTKGNKLTNSDYDRVGTSDYEDLVMVTDNVTRMRLTGAGDARVVKNTYITLKMDVGTTLEADSATMFNSTLDVDGATTLNSTLDVDGGTTLNSTLDVDGGTTLNSTLDVDGGTTLNSTLDVDAATTLNTTLDVDGGTTLNSTLDVDGATTLNSTLDVDGITWLNSSLDVDGNTWLHGSLMLDGAVGLATSLNVGGAAAFYSTVDVDGASTLNNVLDTDGPTTFNSTLDVDGATTLNSTLDVDGATTLNNTLVILSNQADWVTTIENTDDSDGDGLLIKLGRTHGSWSGGSHLQIANPASIIAGSALTTIKGWLNGTSFAVSDLWTIFPGAAIAGALVQITNAVIDEINDGLNLPLTIVPNVQIYSGFSLVLPDIPAFEFPGFCIDFSFLDDLDFLDVFPDVGEQCTASIELFGGVVVPDISVPELRLGPYAIPAIPNIPNTGLPTIAIPNFQFTNVSNSLTRENHFMTFQDKAGRQTGAVLAESVSEWRDNTVLDDIYLTNLAASFIGIDLLGAAVSGFAEITQLVDGFNNIGVAYESGNGDYAEWLERENPNEYIVAGDIVGVRGGKISKDITGAEQTMVVSHTPIVLGNVPAADIRPNGNDVAFMGQVPVKIMGPVSNGDYIVATGAIKGYGKAISASKMQLEDYTKVVGRAWQNIPTQGPKMVNTVIGVNHDDWVSSVKKLDARQTNIDRRVDALETKLQSILGLQLDNKPQVTP